jgi:hypothetical protein
MEKFFLNVFTVLINTVIAVGVVYGMAWLLDQHVDSIVGWVALGLAAGSNRA